MPDEILIPILSLLTLREAVSSGILSQRWRNLWTYISTLNFDPVANKIATKSCFFNPSTAKSRRKYVNWVNNVLAQYKGGHNLEEFGVCFDLARTSPSHVNNWFEYAMSKNIKHLEFNFLKSPIGNPYSDLTHLSRLYFFRILGSRKSCDPAMNLNFMFVGFQSLKSLSLKFINVSCEAIEYFLYSCPLLERLSVHGSSRLYNLRIISPSIMLRHLEIVRCFNIQTIEICDTNLVSFTYSRDSGLRSTMEWPNRIVIKNSPLLVEVLFGAGTLTFAQHMILKLSCFIHQLQILELTLYHHQPVSFCQFMYICLMCLIFFQLFSGIMELLYCWFLIQETKMSYYMLPILTNLKQLKLIVFLGGIEHCLLGFVAMLKNFPYLETFVLQVDVLTNHFYIYEKISCCLLFVVRACVFCFVLIQLKCIFFATVLSSD